MQTGHYLIYMGLYKYGQQICDDALLPTPASIFGRPGADDSPPLSLEDLYSLPDSPATVAA